MRIALVTHKFIRGDGQGRINLEVALAALRRGWHVTLLASEVEDELLSHENLSWIRIAVQRWPTALLKQQVFALRSAIWLRHNRNRVDVVLVNGYITWAAADVNAVHFVHSAWREVPARQREAGGLLSRVYHRFYTALNARLERVAFRHSSHVIAVSAQVGRQLVGLGVAADRLTVIPNGVDTGEFQPGDGGRSASGLPTGELIALFVGDLQTPRKNLHTVLKALRECPALHLAVVGTVGRSPYPALAGELGVADRVHFLGFRRDVPRLMREVDLVVYPSVYEPSGLVLLEGMSSGVPVVTTRSVGAAETVRAGCALVIEHPEDEVSLAQALRSLASSPELRRQMGEEGRRQALENDFAVMSHRYCELIARIAAARERSSPRPLPASPS